MPKYIIVTQEKAALDASLQHLYGTYYKIDDYTWAVQSENDSRQISESLFPRSQDEDTKIPTHVVFRVDAWWGFHNRDLWEWLGRKET